MDFLLNVLSTVIGGLILAFLFYWERKRFPNVEGQWYFEAKTTKTTYKPYERMVTRHVALIWREGNRVGGTTEKIYEHSSDGKKHFVGDDRTRGIVQGSIEKNYWRRNDKIRLHVIESGKIRESTTYYELLVQNSKTLVGTFNSTAADSDGVAVWQREPFKDT